MGRFDCILYIKPQFSQTILYRGNFLTNFADIFAQERSMF